MVRMADGATVLADGEARRIDVGGFAVEVYADAETTGRAFSLIETTESVPGGGPPLHIHRDCAESFYVLAGAYSMHIDGREFEGQPGAFIYVPRGTVHTFRTLVAGSRKLNLYTPAGMIGYFDELAAGVRAGMGEAELDAIASRYEMEIVGPVREDYLDGTSRED